MGGTPVKTKKKKKIIYAVNLKDIVIIKQNFMAFKSCHYSRNSDVPVVNSAYVISVTQYKMKVTVEKIDISETCTTFISRTDVV